MSVISIEELRKKATAEVDISGFEPGEKFTFRLKKISLMGLVKTGKIPNALLTQATDLFKNLKSGEKIDTSDIGKVAEMSKVIDVVCAEAMVEPTFAEASDLLTDNQKMEIFNWTQSGVADLKSFRAEQGDIGPSGDESTV